MKPNSALTLVLSETHWGEVVDPGPYGQVAWALPAGPPAISPHSALHCPMPKAGPITGMEAYLREEAGACGQLGSQRGGTWCQLQG